MNNNEPVVSFKMDVPSLDRLRELIRNHHADLHKELLNEARDIEERRRLAQRKFGAEALATFFSVKLEGQ